MDSIGDLLWGVEQQGPRPKLEVRMGPYGSHLPGLTEKQVPHQTDLDCGGDIQLIVSIFLHMAAWG